MAIEFKDGKYVDPQTGRVTLDPTVYKDWQIAEEAEKNLPPVDYFREKLGLLPEEIIPYGKTPKIDFIKVMKRLKDKPDGKFIEVTAITPTPFGEGKSTVSLGLIEGLGKLGLNVGGALGKDGQLTVMRSFGFGEPYVGRVALVSGEIAEDFAMYYLESEQTPSLCALGTLVGENIISSGGILIQAMPDCSEELLDALEIRAELFSSISQLLSEMTLEEIVEGCFRGLNPEILEEMPLRLQCDCSREYIERVLLSMGENEIRDMIEKQNGCEVECHFCRKHYRFSGEELEALLAQAHKENDGDE